MRSRGVTSGRFLSSADLTNASAVVVLGPDTVQELFGAATSPDGCGRPRARLEVIGVLTPLSSSEQTSNNDVRGHATVDVHPKRSAG